MGTTPTQPASSDAGSSGSGRAPTQQITLLGAVFLGIGAMVGAGIFALLGEAARSPALPSGSPSSSPASSLCCSATQS